MPTIKLKGTDYIYERITADGRLTSYQVKIRRKGFPDHNSSFDDLDEAKAFVRQVLHDQDKGHKIDRLAGHRSTVGQVIDDAVDDLVSGRRKVKGAQSELYRLRAFRRREQLLCATAMADLSEDQFEDWLEQRLEEVKPSTALREIRQLKPILLVAARKLGLLNSPCSFSRTRGLSMSESAGSVLRRRRSFSLNWPMPAILSCSWRPSLHSRLGAAAVNNSVSNGRTTIARRGPSGCLTRRTGAAGICS